MVADDSTSSATDEILAVARHACVALAMTGCVVGAIHARAHAALLFAILLGLAAMTATTDFASPVAVAGLVKILAVALFGLAALIAVAGVASDQDRKRLERAVETYVNVAVVVNIGMMVFVPGDETTRGLTTRLICLLLLVWLVRDMRRVEWRTLSWDRGYMLWHASPLDWILCHAVYRVGLLSLPVFETARHISLEPISLGTMVLLARLHGQAWPARMFFGYADTIAVTTISFASRLADQIEQQSGAASHYPVLHEFRDRWADTIIVPLQTCVALYALGAAFGLIRRPVTAPSAKPRQVSTRDS